VFTLFFFSRTRRRAAYLYIKEKRRSNYSKTIPHLGPKWGWSGENTKRAITYKNGHLRSRPVLKKNSYNNTAAQIFSSIAELEFIFISEVCTNVARWSVCSSVKCTIVTRKHQLHVLIHIVCCSWIWLRGEIRWTSTPCIH